MKETGAEADDWTEHVIVPAASNQYSFADLNVEVLARLRTGLPPATWMKTGFDDGDWPRQRGIFSAMPGPPRVLPYPVRAARSAPDDPLALGGDVPRRNPRC